MKKRRCVFKLSFHWRTCLETTSILRNEKNIDESHVSFNQLVNKETIQHFLYRDFPDDLNTTKLTEPQKEYTIKEVVEATKNIDPELWKK